MPTAMVFITLTTAITFTVNIQRAQATIEPTRKYVDKRKVLKIRYPPPVGDLQTFCTQVAGNP